MLRNLHTYTGQICTLASPYVYVLQKFSQLQWIPATIVFFDYLLFLETVHTNLKVVQAAMLLLFVHVSTTMPCLGRRANLSWTNQMFSLKNMGLKLRDFELSILSDEGEKLGSQICHALSTIQRGQPNKQTNKRNNPNSFGKGTRH